MIMTEAHLAYHRQDGAICRVVDADPVQGLDHGRNEALSGARVAFRCVSHVRRHAEGAHALQREQGGTRAVCRVLPVCLQRMATIATVGLLAQGKDAVPFLEQLVVGDIAGIPNGSGSLSMFTNEKGGIIDDTVVTKVPLGSTHSKHVSFSCLTELVAGPIKRIGMHLDTSIACTLRCAGDG
jgi:Aminomethyltransferase folate-binding domain